MEPLDLLRLIGLLEEMDNCALLVEELPDAQKPELIALLIKLLKHQGVTRETFIDAWKEGSHGPVLA